MKITELITDHNIQYICGNEIKEISNRYYELVYGEIERETEKAIFVSCLFNGRKEITLSWIPKSAIKIIGDRIFIVDWMAKKRGFKLKAFELEETK